MPSHCNSCLIQATCIELCGKQRKFTFTALRAFQKLYHTNYSSKSAGYERQRRQINKEHIKTIQKFAWIGRHKIELNEDAEVYWPHLKKIEIPT